MATIITHGYNNNNSDGCTSAEPSCLKCGPRGCIKCPLLLVHPSRRCVTQCPFGHKPKWSTFVDYMGRICVHNGNLLGLQSHTLTILTGILTGALLSFLVVAVALLYLHRRRKNVEMNSRSDTNSDFDEVSTERRDCFVKQLESLRPYAGNYLAMLNDTRRQLRELHNAGEVSALAAYKPVVRDLAKILLLLNRDANRLNSVVPDDWEHLYNWAEKALKRYKRMSGEPQVEQLINFLQQQESVLPTSRNATTTTMSTFKPDQPFTGSTISLSSREYFDSSGVPINPQWKFEYYSLVDTTSAPRSEFDPGAIFWRKESQNTNSIFLDDDFCQLGFRPQDEITTEL